MFVVFINIIKQNYLKLPLHADNTTFPYQKLHFVLWNVSFLFIDCGRGMRERSPPLPKIAHPSFPRLGKSQASTWLSAMHKSPPEGTAFLITVSPVPGKLTISVPGPPL